MGQAARTTKLLLDLEARDQGGANQGKRCALEKTVAILDAARAFYLDFFLAHPDKLMERVEVISKQTGEVRQGPISADKLLSLSRSSKPSQPVNTRLRWLPGTSASGSQLSPIAIDARSSRM